MRYWIPPILWTVALMLTGGDDLSADRTAIILKAIILAVLRHPLPPEQFDLVHFLVRKTAHLTEYGIYAALLFRAIRNERTSYRWQWAAVAVAIAAAVASLDEFHQSFVASRTSNPVDVVIDTVGATLSVLLIRVAIRRWSRDVILTK